MSSWIYTDPLFYLAAIPAILLIGISKSGFGSGFGGLAVPLIALTVTVPEAAAVLMPLLLVLDVLALRAYKDGYDKALLRQLLPWSMLGIVIGFFLFKYIDTHIVEGVVGIFALGFVAQRLMFPPSPQGVILPRWIGVSLTTVSGFTSFVAHSGSPPLNAYLLPMRLPPLTFASTMAVLFFFLNLSKWIPYGLLGLLDWRNLGTSALLLPFAPIGVWLGLKIARNIQPALFYRLAHFGLFLTGSKLLWDAVMRA